MQVAAEGGVTDEMSVTYERQPQLRSARYDSLCPHYHKFLLSLSQVKECPLPLDMSLYGTPSRPTRRGKKT